MNKEDRALLMLAAKAAGLRHRPELDNTGQGRFMVDGERYEGEIREWHPLTSNHYALDLAIRLRIDIAHGDNNGPCAIAGYYSPKTDRQQYCLEPHEDDPARSIRRAIVRAAAEIGKAMQ